MYGNNQKYTYDIARVVKELGFETGFHAIGHSMGASALLGYILCFPEHVDSFLALDSVGIYVPTFYDYPQQFKRSINEALRLEERLQNYTPHEYTYVALKTRYLQGSSMMGGEHTVEEHAADIMLERGAVRNPITGNFYYARDLKTIMPTPVTYTMESAKMMLSNYKNFQKPHLQMLTSKNSWLKPALADHDSREEVVNKYREIFKEFETNEQFRFFIVDDNHHVHLNHPKMVTDRVNKWIANTADIDAVDKHSNFYCNLLLLSGF